MRLLLAFALLLPVQSEPDKLEAALKKFGDRKYAMYVSGRKAGKLTLKWKMETEEGQRLIRFEDVRTETSGGGTVKETVVEKASLEGLRLVSSRRAIDAEGRKTLDMITVTGSKAAVRFDDEKRVTLDIPEKTIGEAALLRVVCFADRTKGATFAVDVLSMTTGELERREFRCEGPVDVRIGDRKVEAVRWRVKGQEGKPGEHAKNTYWVHPAGHLLKFVGAGGVEYVLESK